MFCFFGATGMWDLSFQTRDQTCTPCIGMQSLNHCTTREVPIFTNFSNRSLCLHTNSLMHPTWGQVGMGKQRRSEGKRSKMVTWVGWKLLMSNVIFILLSYLKVDSLPGFPLEPGGPRSPFWPGMVTPGKPGAPWGPVMPMGPGGPASPTGPFLPGRPGKPGAPLSPLAPAKKKVW